MLEEGEKGDIFDRITVLNGPMGWRSFRYPCRESRE